MQISANGLQIEVDDAGPPGGVPFLLIMGLGMQLTAWPPALVADLVARGHRVIRLDNRDAGLSQGFDHLGVPSLPWAAAKHWLRLPQHPPYTLADMAEDALGVLDALGLERAHVVGASLGGMVAQHLAARHPARLASLTLMMSTSGARHLPQAQLAVQRLLMSRPQGADPEAVVAHLVRVMQTIGSPGYPAPPELLRQRLRASVARAWRPKGTARQLLAVVADGDRTPMLRKLSVPTTVIHGRADPLIPYGCGEQLAQVIPRAQLHGIPGMGHDLPDELLPQLAERMAASAAPQSATACR
jgi:pimeloyl-ACP methyl ester carboxylesterase